MTIDFHTHTFPERIAGATIKALSASAGVRPLYDGTPDGLRQYARASGVDLCVVLNIATNEKQQRAVNDFAASINNTDGLAAFGSVYPHAGSVFAELDYIQSLGLKGVKLHPDYQHFFVDDEDMYPVYRHIARLGLITVFHAGTDIGYPEPVHCTPERLARALNCFGGAPVVAAHLGGYMCWDDTERYLVGRELFLDTAYTFGRIPYPQAKRIIRQHGARRILFGSDAPWSGMGDEAHSIAAMDELSDEEKEWILGGNAAQLLGMGK